jgi:hypothetical protein
MYMSESGATEKIKELILELSADAHIERRGVEKDSAAFFSLTAAIGAYGRVLAHLTLLQAAEEELLAFAGHYSAPEQLLTAREVNYVA